MEITVLRMKVTEHHQELELIAGTSLMKRYESAAQRFDVGQMGGKLFEMPSVRGL